LENTLKLIECQRENFLRNFSPIADFWVEMLYRRVEMEKQDYRKESSDKEDEDFTYNSAMGK
jgi:hypothetical protein